MTEGSDIRSGVRRFILETFLVGEPPESLEDSTSLLTTGIVSSLATLDMVAFLEEEYSIVLGPEDLGVERLDSVDSIVALVEQRREGKTDRL